MADPLFISDLISLIVKGNIRIPSFQRGFVWDAERVAHLMDSIFKGYPFGSLLFWRTKNPLSTERNLGPFPLPTNDPDYPVDYILDGQQRAISIFGVFQTLVKPLPNEDDSWTKIYYDLGGESSAQESQFLALPDEEVDARKHFPLRILFDSPAYRSFLKTMDDAIADQVDQLYKQFTTARIPVQTFTADDRTAVAIVFERINRLGVELDALQLLSAWTWSEDFDLQDKFRDLASELQPYGFNDVGEDSDLLLRCCAAIVQNDASPKTIINLNGAEVRQRFSEIRNGVLGAVDFLRTNLKAYSASILPYTQIIIPLSVFFATDSEQAAHPSSNQSTELRNWIWRTFFSRRYSKRLEQLNTDIKEIRKLKDGQDNSLGAFTPVLSTSFFVDTQFNLRNVDSKTFVLMLASEGPLNLLSGDPIELRDVLRSCNKREFHHVFPRAYLNDLGIDKKMINCPANLCILSRVENNTIGGQKPSDYRRQMPTEENHVRHIMERALCPADIFHDDFERFIHERIEILVAKANSLMGLS